MPPYRTIPTNEKPDTVRSNYFTLSVHNRSVESDPNRGLRPFFGWPHLAFRTGTGASTQTTNLEKRLCLREPSMATTAAIRSTSSTTQAAIRSPGRDSPSPLGGHLHSPTPIWWSTPWTPPAAPTSSICPAWPQTPVSASPASTSTAAAAPRTLPAAASPRRSAPVAATTSSVPARAMTLS